MGKRGSGIPKITRGRSRSTSCSNASARADPGQDSALRRRLQRSCPAHGTAGSSGWLSSLGISGGRAQHPMRAAASASPGILCSGAVGPRYPDRPAFPSAAPGSAGEGVLARLGGQTGKKIIKKEVRYTRFNLSVAAIDQIMR